jgi:peptidoglycan/LPS O-acetylase OafA/YrhL
VLARSQSISADVWTGEAMQEASSKRLDWLDALRGWAILAVVIVHCGQVAHSDGLVKKFTETGQYGVQLFFVVSALTISLTYNSHRGKYGSSARANFGWLIKRFFRIAPIYYLAVIFYSLESYVFFVASRHAYGSIPQEIPILSNIFFIHTWVPSGNNSIVPGGWSIGVEMFFYLLVPLIWMVSSKRRTWLLLAGVFAGIGATLLVAQISTGSFFVDNNSFLYCWFPTQAPVFALGLLFFMHCGHKLGGRLGVYEGGGYVAAALLLILAGARLGTWSGVAPALAPTVFGLAFLFIVASIGSWTRRILVNRPMIFLGQISYSVYILHFAVLDVIRAAEYKILAPHHGAVPIIPIIGVVVIGTCCLASVSKRFIEDLGIQVGAKLCNAVVKNGVGRTAIVEGSPS